MATSVATPLERHLGLIADVTEMTSSSRVGTANVTLQFDLDRDIDGAARDVQAAINAARVDLPATLRTNPTYRKVNPADAPIMILALTSRDPTPGQIYDAASNIVQQQLSPGERRRRRRDRRRLAAGGAGRAQSAGAGALRHRPGGRARRPGLGQRQPARRASSTTARLRLQVYTNDAGTKAADYAPLLVAYRNGAAVRLSDIAEVIDGVEDIHNLGLFVHKANGKPVTSPAVIVRSAASRAPTSSPPSTG